MPPFRPRFFSRWEWWYHLAMMPVLFPLGNYYFIGPAYFREPAKFWSSTALVCLLYWFSIVVLTLAVRWVVARFPHLWQALPRMLTGLGLVGGLTAGLAVFDVWAYSLVPATGVHFSWAAVQPIWVLGALFDVFLCLALSVFYSYGQWRHQLVTNEQLKRDTLQQQFDTLKRQLNPHFLFNSLNSLSLLIGDDPGRAEQFVDNLAQVYRYLLQASPSTPCNTRPAEPPGQPGLVPLQAELDFARTYAALLSARYGDGLRIEQRVPPLPPAFFLPHLSLQAVIDHAVQHHVMLPHTPLVITITASLLHEHVCVQHNHQPKAIRLEVSVDGLANLRAAYELLTSEPVRITQTAQQVAVLLPLLRCA